MIVTNRSSLNSKEGSTEHVTFAQVHTTCRDRRRPATSVSLRCRPRREQPVAPSSVYLCSKGGDIAYGVTSCGSPVRMMLRLPADAGCGKDANGTSDDFSSTPGTAGGQAPIAASAGAAVVCANAALCANSTEPRSLGLAWGRAFTVLLRPADAVEEEFASVERMADVASERPHPADRNTLFHGVVAFLVCVGVALLALLVVWTKPGTSVSRAQTPCGGNFTDSNGIIETPNFPGLYPPMLNCLWVIQSSDRRGVVIISVIDFELEESDACVFDKLRMEAGNPPGPPRLYCGGDFERRYGVSEMQAIGRMTLQFNSDESVELRGFRIGFWGGCIARQRVLPRISFSKSHCKTGRADESVKSLMVIATVVT
ncbi:unnamed protein product [Lampetra fluviatilis]